MREFKLYTFTGDYISINDNDKNIYSKKDQFDDGVYHSNKILINITGRWKIIQYEERSVLWIESMYKVRNKKLIYDRRFMSFLYEDKYEYSDKEINIWIDSDEICEDIVPIEHPIQECSV